MTEARQHQQAIAERQRVEAQRQRVEAERQQQEQERAALLEAAEREGVIPEEFKDPVTFLVMKTPILGFDGVRRFDITTLERSHWCDPFTRRQASEAEWRDRIDRALQQRIQAWINETQARRPRLGSELDQLDPPEPNDAADEGIDEAERRRGLDGDDAVSHASVATENFRTNDKNEIARVLLGKITKHHANNVTVQSRANDKLVIHLVSNCIN